MGIASLGGIVAIGLLIILGCIAILSAILGLVIVAFAVPTFAGSLVGESRQLERRGRKYDTRFSRVQGLRSLLSEYWKVIIATIVISVGLFIGLAGGPN